VVFAIYLFGEAAMATGEGNGRERTILSGDSASGRDSEGSSLVPMLVAGLVLILIGAVVIMAFV
jgi:hypothetical protein